MFSQFKYAEVVGPDIILVVWMSRWPLIEVEREAEHFRLQQVFDLDLLLQQFRHNIIEKPRRNKGILVIDNMRKNHFNRSFLVIPKGILDGVPVDVLPFRK